MFNIIFDQRMISGPFKTFPNKYCFFGSSGLPQGILGMVVDQVPIGQSLVGRVDIVVRLGIGRVDGCRLVDIATHLDLYIGIVNGWLI